MPQPVFDQTVNVEALVTTESLFQAGRSIVAEKCRLQFDRLRCHGRSENEHQERFGERSSDRMDHLS